MAIVVDASVSLCWAFPDEEHVVATMVLERLSVEEARIPALWWFEIRNALIVNERRGRLSEAQTAAILQHLARLPIVVDRTPVEAEVIGLARRHRLTVYDASYLELAGRVGCPLATLDTALTTAARREKISLIGA